MLVIVHQQQDRTTFNAVHYGRPNVFFVQALKFLCALHTMDWQIISVSFSLDLPVLTS